MFVDVDGQFSWLNIHFEAERAIPSEGLEEGMVIMLELGIYLPGEIGVRLEDGILVTSDGAQVLTEHNKNLP